MNLTVKNRRNARTTATLILAVGVAALLVAAATATANGQEPAEITVDWDEDGMGFEVTSSEGLSNIIVLLCDGTAHKHEAEFVTGEDEDEILVWAHREDQDIVAIWVKSGSNHDAEGPAPPAPFNNDGAGEYFENPFADCDEVPLEECIGPQDIRARTDGDTIVVSWDAFIGATGYNLYRDAGVGFTLLVTLDGDTTTHTDGDVTNGDTYAYRVTALVGEGEDQVETEACDEVEITAIPVFPTVFAGAMAGIIGIGAYVFSRRRLA